MTALVAQIGIGILAGAGLGLLVRWLSQRRLARAMTLAELEREERVRSTEEAWRRRCALRDEEHRSELTAAQLQVSELRARLERLEQGKELVPRFQRRIQELEPLVRELAAREEQVRYLEARVERALEARDEAVALKDLQIQGLQSRLAKLESLCGIVGDAATPGAAEAREVPEARS